MKQWIEIYTHKKEQDEPVDSPVIVHVVIQYSTVIQIYCNISAR